MKDIEIDRGRSAADGEDSEHLEMAEWKSWINSTTTFIYWQGCGYKSAEISMHWCIGKKNYHLVFFPILFF